MLRHSTITGLVLIILMVPNVSHSRPSKRYDQKLQSCRTLKFETLWRGYKLFQNNCKTCHHRKNRDGATFLHTESKSMRAWNRVFLQKRVPCAKNGKWRSLNMEELLLVNDYLFHQAVDAYDPAADGG